MKNNMVSGLTVLFLVAGCVSVSNPETKDEAQQNIQNKIEEGTTTMKQVRSALGGAAIVSLSGDGAEIWTYTYIHSSSQLEDFIPLVKFFAQGSYINPLRLVITFDKKSIVSKYKFHKDVLNGINYASGV